MIRYDLKCSAGCAFEAWFQGAAAFDREAAAGRLECPFCGDRAVKKALMAPAVRPARSALAAPAAAAPQPETPEPPTAAPPQNIPAAAADVLSQARKERAEFAEALNKARSLVEANTRDVGREFATMAQKMHDGEMEHESIRGQADRKEAEALQEAGVPFGVLPDFSDDTVN